MALKKNGSHIADSKGPLLVIAIQQVIAGYVADTQRCSLLLVDKLNNLWSGCVVGWTMSVHSRLPPIISSHTSIRAKS